MDVYKNDGSGEVHVASDGLHIKVIKGNASLVGRTKASLEHFGRPVAFKTLSKTARRSIRELITQYSGE